MVGAGHRTCARRSSSTSWTRWRRYGRIWRLRYDGREAVAATATNIGQPAIPAITPAFAPPRMYSETPAQLVAHLTHPNGWWRDMAQRLLVLKQDKSVVPALQQMVAVVRQPASRRFHAMWTLEGLGALDAGLVREEMKDKSPRMRVQAIRASETLYKAGDKSFADDYRALTKDPDPNVVDPGAALGEPLQADRPGRRGQGGAGAPHRQGRGAHRRAPARAPAARLRRRPPRRAAHAGRREAAAAGQRRLRRGLLRVPRSRRLGAPLEGAPPGTMMAPPLAGSPRVQGHRDYVIKVLLQGLTGPLDGKTYRDVMVPMGNTDEWIAGIALYVRTSFGNNGGLVTPADVARVRAEIGARKTPWTMPELEASLPRPLDSQQWKLTASHGADTAAGAATLRGWTSGVPQAPDMWFAVELPQPAMVTELQFDSIDAEPSAGQRQGRRAAGGSASAWRPRRDQLPPCRHRPSAILAATACRCRRTARLGVKPVAEGKGDGAHTTITFAPVRAKFVRITQTDTVADAPAWSIRNLRIFEAPGGPATK